MQKKRPSRRLLAMWTVYAVLVALLLFSAFFFFLRFTRLPYKLVAVIGGLLAVLWLAAVTVYLPLRYRSLAFQLTETELTVYSGILFRCKRTVPLRGVQYVTLIVAPPERLLQIGTLMVFVTGGMVLIEGIPLADAHALQRKLSAFAEVPNG